MSKKIVLRLSLSVERELINVTLEEIKRVQISGILCVTEWWYGSGTWNRNIVLKGYKGHKGG